MKCVLTLEDVVFSLNQDEDILVMVVDYETGKELIKETWKTCLKHVNYDALKDYEVESVSPYSNGNNVGFEITIQYY